MAKWVTETGDWEWMSLEGYSPDPLLARTICVFLPGEM